MTARNSGPTVRRRRLGGELRRLREAAGIEAGKCLEERRAKSWQERGRIMVILNIKMSQVLALYPLTRSGSDGGGSACGRRGSEARERDAEGPRSGHSGLSGESSVRLGRDVRQRRS